MSDELDRQQTLRVLALLDALAHVGIVPTPASALHELAYLANVLSPVFELTPLNAKLLKSASGAYYPELQHAVDRLVGRTLVDAVDLRYELDSSKNRDRVLATYRLRREAVKNALQRYSELFAAEYLFLKELASAYSRLSDTQLGLASEQDARYADSSVDINNVIDFGEWELPATNYSCNAAMAFAPSRQIHPAERLYLYMDHLGLKVANVG